MRLIIQDNYAQLSLWTASYIVRRIRDFAPDLERPFVLGLPTGSTPIGTYKSLIQFYEQGLVSFEHVITFNMDEYVGLPEDNPQSYHYFMWENLFSRINIKKENVHIPDGMAADLRRECEDYEEAIWKVGGIELFLGGVGSDGHIAFNEPGSSLGSRSRVKTIHRDTKLANAVFFNNNVDAVPDTAITVGVGTIMDAQEVLLLVSGHGKARALEQIVQQGVNHLRTASCLQLHPHALIACDEEATGELKVATVRYFKDIEGSNLDYRQFLD